MDLNLEKYEYVVDSDENSCSLRYKLSGGTVGVMRYNYYLNVGRRIKQNIVVLREMDIDPMIANIMFEEGFSPELGEPVVHTLKDYSYKIVNKFLKETPTVFLEQPASD